jgi:alkylated DNA nucleotide flippase Atl1
MQKISNPDAIKLIINCIPLGSVGYYGQVADVLATEFGIFMRGQMVGWALNGFNEERLASIAWQRVITKTGHIALLKLGFKGNEQIALLEQEGVDVSGDFCGYGEVLYSHNRPYKTRKKSSQLITS